MDTDIIPTLPLNLKLGQRVRLWSDDAYGWGTVVQITETEVHVFRPFVHIADFTYTDGVLHYIGSETVKIARDDNRAIDAHASAPSLR